MPPPPYSIAAASARQTRPIVRLAVRLSLAGALAGALACMPPLACAQSLSSDLDRESDEIPERLLQRGREALDAKRYERARTLFGRAVRMSPTLALAHVGLGEALFWLGRLGRARRAFERAAALEPDLLPALNGIGHSCLHLSQQALARPRTRQSLLACARASFDRALALQPDYQPAREGVELLELVRDGQGHSLAPLQLLIAGLLSALCVLGGLRLRAHGFPRWRRYARPLVWFVVTRGALLAALAAAPELLAEAPQHPMPILTHPGSFLLDSIAGRWDANLYADVWFHGYRVKDDGLWSTVGQYPLLPVLLGFVAYLLDDVHLAALLLPNLALLAATLVLYRLVEEEHGQRLATGAVCAMLVHPGSLYGSVLYAESLTLLALCCARYNMRDGAHASAFAWGVLAGLSRVNAIAIVPWFLWDVIRSRGTRSIPSLLACVAPAIGMGLFMVYLAVEFGDAMAYFHELRSARFPDHVFFVALWEARGLVAHLLAPQAHPLHGGPLPMLVLSLLCTVVYIATCFALLRRRAFGEALLVASGTALGLTSTLAAQVRYLWVLFPAAVALARACDRPILRYAVPLCSTAALLAAAVGFARWWYVT